MGNVKCVKNENRGKDMSETFKMMTWQLDQFIDQVLVALDQLISIVLSPFVWFFQHPLADFCKWLFGPQSIAQGKRYWPLFSLLWEHMQSFSCFTQLHW